MDIPLGQKQFECEHCRAAILIPIDLPPTSAPCPVCQAVTTSPALDEPELVGEPIKGSAEQRPLEYKDYASNDETKGGSGILWGMAALTFLGLLVAGFFVFKKFQGNGSQVGGSDPVGEGSLEQKERPPAGEVGEGAIVVLKKFLSATSLEEKAKYVIGKEATLPEMKTFYGDGPVEEAELSADSFSEWAMDMSDTARGIFLLEFDRPKQFRMGELFGPITDPKTHLSLETPDLHTRSRAYRHNFEMEAIRAKVYLRKIDGELLIDWHTYVQTKDRTFRDFVECPVPGRKKTFRVGLGEDVTTLYNDDQTVRRYRLTDPAHYEEDFAVVSVKRSSEIGKLLEKFAWTDVVGKAPSGTGATVALEWSSDPTPVLILSEVICWEFLGVGGDPSNLVSAN